MLKNAGFILREVKVKEETGERGEQPCAERLEMNCQESSQEKLHPFGIHAAMRRLREASDAWISLAEEEEAQMGAERRPLPGFKN